MKTSTLFKQNTDSIYLSIGSDHPGMQESFPEFPTLTHPRNLLKRSSITLVFRCLKYYHNKL